jgi:hypothetical protein
MDSRDFQTRAACSNPFGSYLCLFFSVLTLPLDIRDAGTHERASQFPLNPMDDRKRNVANLYPLSPLRPSVQKIFAPFGFFPVG